jgi:hypothetical protein
MVGKLVENIGDIRAYVKVCKKTLLLGNLKAGFYDFVEGCLCV